jgi:hypothetical protein
MTQPKGERPASATSTDRAKREAAASPAQPTCDAERAAERTRMLAILERARQNVKRIEKRELAGEQVSSELLNMPLR